MGTATHSISESGTFNKNVRGALVTSGAHTTTTSPSSLTDGAAGGGSAITAEIGWVLTIRADEDMRVKFGGGTPSATDGHIIFANETTDLEVSHRGTIEIRDVA